MINHEHKCIFIHIPGTAGTSIEAVFKADQWLGSNSVVKHLTASEIKSSYPVEYDTYFKFTAIRNTWSWLVSMFGKQSTHSVFKEFLKQEAPCCFVPWHKHLMSDYLTCDVDFIIRFENLQEDFDIVCDKIGIPKKQLPHIHNAKHKHYTEYYDEETKQIVAEKYAKDIEYFGYEFGE